MPEFEDDRRSAAGAPEPSVRTWRVAAYALCLREDQLLVVRASARTEVQGRWFLPGGGIEFGEHPSDAVLRELHEETGLVGRDPTLLGVLSDVRDRKSGGRIFTVRVIYVIDGVDGELVHETAGTSDEARWIARGELVDLDVASYVLGALDLYEK